MVSKQSRPSASRGARSASGTRRPGAAPKQPNIAPKPAAASAKPAKLAVKKPRVAAKTNPTATNSRGTRTFKTAANQSAAMQWLGSMRLSLELVTILGILVIGIFALAPQVQIWFTQRQQLSDLQTQLQQAKQNLAQMKVERQRWEDPVYIRSQARDRLYYVLPGEVSYLVMDQGNIDTADVSGTMGAKLASERNTSHITTGIQRTKNNWVNSLMQSVVRAGLEEPTSTSATAKVGQ